MKKRGILVSRNVSAEKLIVCSEPVIFPVSETLYQFDVGNWADKSSFYSHVAYSVGSPSTQKKITCKFLDCETKRHTRTCKGVYVCPKSTPESPCEIFHLRFHRNKCEKHGCSLTHSGKCTAKLSFYIPTNNINTKRLLIIRGNHNHGLISKFPKRSQRKKGKRKKGAKKEEGDDTDETEKPKKPTSLQFTGKIPGDGIQGIPSILIRQWKPTTELPPPQPPVVGPYDPPSGEFSIGKDRIPAPTFGFFQRKPHPVGTGGKILPSFQGHFTPDYPGKPYRGPKLRPIQVVESEAKKLLPSLNSFAPSSLSVPRERLLPPLKRGRTNVTEVNPDDNKRRKLKK